MKSVDATPKHFKLRFSGMVSVDWVDHVNELELQCVRKHCWSDRQIFYALRSTVHFTWTGIANLGRAGT